MLLACCCLVALLALLCIVYATTNWFSGEDASDEENTDKSAIYSKQGGGGGTQTTAATTATKSVPTTPAKTTPPIFPRTTPAAKPTTPPSAPTTPKPTPSTSKPTPSSTSKPSPSSTSKPSPSATSKPTPSSTSKPTPSSTSKPTTSSTSKPTPSSTSKPTPPSTPSSLPTTPPSPPTTPKTEPPGLRRYTTVCTVSYLAFGLPLPLGGECDIIYYDSLLLRPEDTFMGTFTNAYLKPIFDAANDGSHKTQFGMSIHAPAINDFTTEVKSAAGMQHYKDHWQHKLYHWGVVNIHELILKTTPDILKASLTILKELKDTATAAGKNASMVVGLFCKSPGGCDKVTEYLKTVYLPDGILVLGHLSYRDNNISDCTILPRSIIQDPVVMYKNLSYMHALNDSINTVSYLQAQGLDTMYAVTATMAGRWYKPRQPDNHNVKYPGKYRVSYHCKVEDYPQKAHVQDVCGNKSLEFTKHFDYTAYHLTAFAWDKKAGLTVTFESLEALQKKINDGGGP
ncbi:uncharacterized protein LOC119405000 isoform X2 [Rhipicephalus sanguineus]|uniref:uncharacterized protein LOC119405000 isoform X2 n=1 Tax=Rhipicephalus sanguineus TaxID=34632 RepID=UPI0020C40D36|nr:uncharacterized protein LOC119405000 isoform X2 [Rhipicephalus sanguineus]